MPMGKWCRSILSAIHCKKFLSVFLKVVGIIRGITASLYGWNRIE